MITLPEQALYYARIGLFVFPVEPEGKNPYNPPPYDGFFAPHGFNSGTRDEKKIVEWWAAMPNLNIGIACGLSDLAVLDCDEGLETIEQACVWRDQHLAKTFTVRTGRRTSIGLQFWFKGRTKSRGFELDGVRGDVKSDGGYVVAPPSVHPISKQTYQIIRNVAFTPVPQVIVNMSRKPLPRLRPSIAEKIKASHRHEYLKRCAVELAWIGITGDMLISNLKWFYENYCERDAAKDAQIARGELKSLADWAVNNPMVAELTTSDFIQLKACEREDPKVTAAWNAELFDFANDAETAMNFLIQKLRSSGSNAEQTIRICAASPLNEKLNEQFPVPDFLKDGSVEQ